MWRRVGSGLARLFVQGLLIILFRAENAEGPKGAQVPICCHVQWLDSVKVDIRNIDKIDWSRHLDCVAA